MAFWPLSHAALGATTDARNRMLLRDKGVELPDGSFFEYMIDTQMVQVAIPRGWKKHVQGNSTRSYVKYVRVKDHAYSFPSDELVTKLLLLMG